MILSDTPDQYLILLVRLIIKRSGLISQAIHICISSSLLENISFAAQQYHEIHIKFRLDYKLRLIKFFRYFSKPIL
jgi:hypothetical protein